MNVHLTFDIEVWCNGWANLDREFASCYPRYVYGHSRRGDYALPKTLEVLSLHGLRGIFFVEPLFAARFGTEYLGRIVRLIDDAAQEVQLHLHPEWTDEIYPPILCDVSRKRQHLTHYSGDEQVELIRYGRALLESELGKKITAFRAGSFAANAETFQALARNNISIDSSINACHSISAPELVEEHGSASPFLAHGVTTFPVSVFRDGFGRVRPAQVGACGYGEMCDALVGAAQAGWSDFVIVSHNFEMLKPASSDPDLIVARRFRALCRFLDENRTSLPTAGFVPPSNGATVHRLAGDVRSQMTSTAWRHVEQLARRLV